MDASASPSAATLAGRYVVRCINFRTNYGHHEGKKWGYILVLRICLFYVGQ